MARTVHRGGWRQPSRFGRAIEIAISDNLAAILRFQRWGRQCDATSADGMWRFRRQRFFGRSVLIESIPVGNQVGTFRSRFTGGALTLADGKVYDWEYLGFWRGNPAFFMPSGFPIVTLSSKRFSLKDSGEVSVQREYSSLEELPLLVLFGSYLTIMNQRRRRAA